MFFYDWLALKITLPVSYFYCFGVLFVQFSFFCFYQIKIKCFFINLALLRIHWNLRLREDFLLIFINSVCMSTDLIC